MYSYARKHKHPVLCHGTPQKEVQHAMANLDQPYHGTILTKSQIEATHKLGPNELVSLLEEPATCF
jgi:hypothetical protein